MGYNNILTDEELNSLLTPQQLDDYKTSKEREDLEDGSKHNTAKLAETVAVLEEAMARLSMRVNHLERQLVYQKQLQMNAEETAASHMSNESVTTVLDDDVLVEISKTPLVPLMPPQKFIPRSERHRTAKVE